MTPDAPTGLRRRSEFLFVRNGESFRRRTVVVQARKRDGTEAVRFGVTATKKVGNAVIRNRSKRRLRAAAHHLLEKHGVKGVDYVFIARQHTPTVEWQALLDDMETALVTLRKRLIGANSPSENDTR